jgi:hypothetical protein
MTAATVAHWRTPSDPDVRILRLGANVAWITGWRGYYRATVRVGGVQTRRAGIATLSEAKAWCEKMVAQ